MAELKESWAIEFTDRVGCIVYSTEKAAEIVRGEYDSTRFARGTVRSVEYRVTEWFGSHDDDTRRFEVREARDVPLARFMSPFD
jgi:hypothetical protein